MDGSGVPNEMEDDSMRGISTDFQQNSETEKNRNDDVIITAPEKSTEPRALKKRSKKTRSVDRRSKSVEHRRRPKTVHTQHRSKDDLDFGTFTVIGRPPNPWELENRLKRGKSLPSILLKEGSRPDFDTDFSVNGIIAVTNSQDQQSLANKNTQDPDFHKSQPNDLSHSPLYDGGELWKRPDKEESVKGHMESSPNEEFSLDRVGKSPLFVGYRESPSDEITSTVIPLDNDHGGTLHDKHRELSSVRVDIIGGTLSTTVVPSKHPKMQLTSKTMTELNVGELKRYFQECLITIKTNQEKVEESSHVTNHQTGLHLVEELTRNFEHLIETMKLREDMLIPQMLSLPQSHQPVPELPEKVTIYLPIDTFPSNENQSNFYEIAMGVFYEFVRQLIPDAPSGLDDTLSVSLSQDDDSGEDHFDKEEEEEKDDEEPGFRTMIEIQGNNIAINDLNSEPTSPRSYSPATQRTTTHTTSTTTLTTVTTETTPEGNSNAVSSHIYTIFAEMSATEYNKLIRVFTMLKRQIETWFSQLEESQIKINHVTKENNQLNNNNNILRMSLETANKAIREINGKVHELKETLVPLRNENTALRGQNEELNKNVSDLKMEVASKKQENGSLQKMKERFDEKLKAKDSEIENFRAEMQEKIKKLEELYRNYQHDMEERNTGLIMESEELRKIHEAMKNEIEALQKENRKSKKDYEELCENNEHLETELRVKRNTNIELLNASKGHGKSQESVKEMEAFYRREVEESNIAISKSKVELEKLKEEIRSSEEENLKLKQNVKELESQVRIMESMKTEALTGKSISAQQVDFLENEVELLKKDNKLLESIKQDKIDMEVNQKSFVNRIKELEKQSEELDVLKREQFSQQNESQRMRAEIENLTDELKEYERVKRESVQEKNENERLRMELQHLQKQLQLVEDRQKIASASPGQPFNAELKAELENIRNQMRDLANENRERRMEIYTSEMKGELALIKDQIKELDSSTKQRNDTMPSPRQSSSSPTNLLKELSTTNSDQNSRPDSTSLSSVASAATFSQQQTRHLGEIPNNGLDGSGNEVVASRPSSVASFSATEDTLLSSSNNNGYGIQHEIRVELPRDTSNNSTTSNDSEDGIQLTNSRRDFTSQTKRSRSNSDDVAVIDNKDGERKDTKTKTSQSRRAFKNSVSKSFDVSGGASATRSKRTDIDETDYSSVARRDVDNEDDVFFGKRDLLRRSKSVGDPARRNRVYVSRSTEMSMDEKLREVEEKMRRRRERDLDDWSLVTPSIGELQRRPYQLDSDGIGIDMRMGTQEQYRREEFGRDFEYGRQDGNEDEDGGETINYSTNNDDHILRHRNRSPSIGRRSKSAGGPHRSGDNRRHSSATHRGRSPVRRNREGTVSPSEERIQRENVASMYGVEIIVDNNKQIRKNGKMVDAYTSYNKLQQQNVSTEGSQPQRRSQTSMDYQHYHEFSDGPERPYNISSQSLNNPRTVSYSNQKTRGSHANLYGSSQIEHPQISSNSKQMQEMQNTGIRYQHNQPQQQQQHYSHQQFENQQLRATGKIKKRMSSSAIDESSSSEWELNQRETSENLSRSLDYRVIRRGKERVGAVDHIPIETHDVNAMLSEAMYARQLGEYQKVQKRPLILSTSPPHYAKTSTTPNQYHQPRLSQENTHVIYQDDYDTSRQRRNTSPVKVMKGRIGNVEYYGDEMKRQNLSIARSKTLDKDFRTQQQTSNGMTQKNLVASANRSLRNEEMLQTIKAEQALKLTLTPKEIHHHPSGNGMTSRKFIQQSNKEEDLVHQDRMEQARQNMLLKMQTKQSQNVKAEKKQQITRSGIPMQRRSTHRHSDTNHHSDDNNKSQNIHKVSGSIRASSYSHQQQKEHSRKITSSVTSSQRQRQRAQAEQQNFLLGQNGQEFKSLDVTKQKQKKNSQKSSNHKDNRDNNSDRKSKKDSIQNGRPIDGHHGFEGAEHDKDYHCDICRRLNRNRTEREPARYCWERYYAVGSSTPQISMA